MKNSIIRSTLVATALLLSTNLALAVDVTVKTPDVKGDAKATVEKAKSGAKATADKTKLATTGAKAAVVDTKAGAKAAVTDTKAGAKAVVTDTKAGAKAAVTDTKAGAKAVVVNSKAAAVSVKPGVVDINTATAAELKAIPGVGDTYATKIIANRPYANKTQLKTRNVVPAPVYEAIKNQVVAKQAVQTKKK